MIRTLLFISMLFVSGQSAAFPVFYYQNIRHALAGLQTNPLQTLMIIEAGIQTKSVDLLPHEKNELTAQLLVLKEQLCQYPGQPLLIWPFLMMILTQILCFHSDDPMGYNFSFYCASILSAIIIEWEHVGARSAIFAQQHKIEKKINNIVALLKQQ